MAELAPRIDDLKDVTINNTKYIISKTLSGDLKYLAAISGVNNANSSYPCVWCKCKKNDFHDISQKWSISDPNCGARSIKETTDYMNLRSTEARKGYVNKPIFSTVEYNEIVVDLLHMYLRITDRLIDGLILRLTQLDKNESDNLLLRPHFKAFLDFLKDTCNISNPFYTTSKNENGNGKVIRLRAYNGEEKSKILKQVNFKVLFPEKFKEFFEDYQVLFKMFYNIYHLVKINALNHVLLKEKVQLWFTKYKKVFFQNEITPYIHIFVYHLPEFVKRYKDINLFNTEGLEKYNDVMSSYYYQSNNKINDEFLKQLIHKRNRIEYHNKNEIGKSSIID